jgi:hypothetical protein
MVDFFLKPNDHVRVRAFDGVRHTDSAGTVQVDARSIVVMFAVSSFLTAIITPS